MGRILMGLLVGVSLAFAQTPCPVDHAVVTADGNLLTVAGAVDVRLEARAAHSQADPLRDSAGWQPGPIPAAALLGSAQAGQAVHPMRVYLRLRLCNPSSQAQVLVIAASATPARHVALHDLRHDVQLYNPPLLSPTDLVLGSVRLRPGEANTLWLTLDSLRPDGLVPPVEVRRMADQLVPTTGTRTDTSSLLLGGTAVLLVMSLVLALILGERSFILYFLFMVLSLAPVLYGSGGFGASLFATLAVPLSRIFFVVFWLNFFPGAFSWQERAVALGVTLLKATAIVLSLLQPELSVLGGPSLIQFFSLVLLDALVVLTLTAVAFLRRQKYGWLAFASLVPAALYALLRLLVEVGLDSVAAWRGQLHLVLMNSLYALSGVSILIIVILRYRDERVQRQRMEQEKQQLLETENHRLELQVAERTEEIQQQADALEKTNVALTDSITYAKRLQQNLLPTLAELQAVAPAAALLYEPRDIVSGDFYWCAQREGWHFLAIGDGTGHGVPGAFMTVVALTLLNEAIRLGDAAPTPLAIAVHVRQQLDVMLRQQAEGAMDGFDLALLAWHPAEPVLHFLGAGRPVLLQRDGVWQEMPATGPGLGGRRHELPTVVSMPADGIECLALYTDGYVDQFGGNPPRKLLRKNLLTQLNSGPERTPAQHVNHLRDFLGQWQGSQRRLDDVSVLIWQPVAVHAEV